LTNKLFYIIFITTISFAFINCSTKKNTLITREYHNITGRYNAYFNGNTRFKNALININTNNKENYKKLLPVFVTVEQESVSSIFPDMDYSIEKCVKVINKHEIKAKPKKKSSKKKKKTKDGEEAKPENVYKNIIDDCYFLMAKSNFYKRDYNTALSILDFMDKKYGDYPIRVDVNLLMARCYLELDKLIDAKDFLDKVESEKAYKLNKKKQKLFNAISADYYIRNKEYDEAIKKLEFAIKYSHKKPEKARYTYIIAQLYQEKGDYARASLRYSEVAKYNPTYEMIFNALIAKAMAYSGRGSSWELKSSLNNMTKDDKNKEYLDQIYYALGEIESKENNKKQAINYYKLSTVNSVSNDLQKGLSFSRLGDLYYALSDYKNSYNFYDSTIIYLPQNHENYSKFLTAKNNLKDVVNKILIVEVEDSLQNLANMNERDRMKIINKKIEDINKEQERLRDQADQNQQSSMVANQLRNNQQVGGMGNQWYFYNTAALSFGFSEFTKKWGTRKLGDNWRRINKNVTSFNSDLVANNDSTGNIQPGVKDLTSADFYLKKLPLTKEKMEASNKKVADALYNLGVLYKENLGDNKKSIESFEDLLRRNPNSEYKLQTYYYLYLIYELEGDIDKSNEYKQKILYNYPNSDYALLIKDIRNAKKILNEVHDIYSEAYKHYKYKNYDRVIDICDNSIEKYPNNSLTPKFALLKAYSLGEQGQTDELIKTLELIVSNYPHSEEKVRSEEMINQLKTINVSSKKNRANNISNSSSIYGFNPKSEHFYILVLSKDIKHLNTIKNAISDYNSEFYRLDNLTASDLVLNKDYKIIIVKSFKNKDLATDYFKNINNNNNIKSNLDNINIEKFIISIDNYILFYNDKNIDNYFTFFNEYYNL